MEDFTKKKKSANQSFFDRDHGMFPNSKERTPAKSVVTFGSFPTNFQTARQTLPHTSQSSQEFWWERLSGTPQI